MIFVAIEVQENKLVELRNQLNYEFVLYGMNESQLASFSMFAELDDKEVCHWAGTLANGAIFRYRSLDELDEAKKQNEIYMARKTILQEAVSPDLLQNTSMRDKLDHQYSQELQACFDREARNGSDPVFVVDGQEVKQSVAGEETRDGNDTSSVIIQLAPEPSNELSARNQQTSADSLQECTYPRPEYLCNVCYLGVCGPVCQNSSTEIENSKTRISVPRGTETCPARAEKDCDSLLCIGEGKARKGVKACISPSDNAIPARCKLCGKIGCDRSCLGFDGNKRQMPRATAAVKSAGLNGLARKRGSVTCRAKLYCDYCEEFGHKDEFCWVLHPELQPLCIHCNQRGHFSHDCWSVFPDKAPK